MIIQAKEEFTFASFGLIFSQVQELRTNLLISGNSNTLVIPDYI